MQKQTRREWLYEVIFGTHTPAGKRFDMWLIYAILLSVLVLVLDSVERLHGALDRSFVYAEWAFTLLFTVEYALRLYCTPNRWRYALSFYGIVDLLSILPTYLGLIFGNLNYLLVVRLLRVLRIFRVLKLVRYLEEANLLVRSMVQSRHKIFVFFATVVIIATIFGSLMYVVEGPTNGFTSIPKSIYWTIVTITTVGYGDITPQTVAGQFIASLAMLTGYSIIAVPTGILTAELSREMQREHSRRQCPKCQKSGHDTHASFCQYCGASLHDNR